MTTKETLHDLVDRLLNRLADALEECLQEQVEDGAALGILLQAIRHLLPVLAITTDAILGALEGREALEIVHESVHAMGHDHLVGRKPPLLHLDVLDALDGLERAQFVGGHEREGGSRLAQAPRAARAMHVLLG